MYIAHTKSHKLHKLQSHFTRIAIFVHLATRRVVNITNGKQDFSSETRGRGRKMISSTYIRYFFDIWNITTRIHQFV